MEQYTCPKCGEISYSANTVGANAATYCEAEIHRSFMEDAEEIEKQLGGGEK